MSTKQEQLVLTKPSNRRRKRNVSDTVRVENLTAGAGTVLQICPTPIDGVEVRIVKLAKRVGLSNLIDFQRSSVAAIGDDFSSVGRDIRLAIDRPQKIET